MCRLVFSFALLLAALGVQAQDTKISVYDINKHEANEPKIEHKLWVDSTTMARPTMGVQLAVLKDSMTIDATAPLKELVYMNEKGETVSTTQLDGATRTRVLVPDLPAGQYVLEFRSTNGAISSFTLEF